MSMSNECRGTPGCRPLHRPDVGIHHCRQPYGQSELSHNISSAPCVPLIPSTDRCAGDVKCYRGQFELSIGIPSRLCELDFG